MKKAVLTLLFLFLMARMQAQNVYERIDPFDEYKKSWAKVKLNGKYGFINKNGKEIVTPKYDVIDEFDLKLKGCAEVKIDGRFAFIDKKGREILQKQ